MMKKGIVFSAIVVFSITMAMPVWAKQQQAPAAQPGMQQVPARPTQVPGATQMMPIVRGHVKSPSGQGVAGVEISIRKVHEGGRVSDYRTYTTTNTGGYHFNFASENIGGTYKIVPKHKDFPAGQYFTPNDKQITLAGGINMVDFSFAPPPHEVRGQVKLYSRPGQAMGIQFVEMTLSKLSEGGSGQGEMHKTDYYGFYSFTVPYENIGMSYKIVPKYLNWSPGENITPKDRTFTLAKGINTIDFEITAPDLMVDFIRKQMLSTDQFAAEFAVKNEGSASSPPTKVHVKVGAHNYRKDYYGNCYQDGTGRSTEIVYDLPGLAPGGIKVFVPTFRFYTDTNAYIEIAIDAVHELDWVDNNKGAVFSKETCPTADGHR